MSNLRDPFGPSPAPTPSGQPKPSTPRGSFPGYFAHLEQAVEREAKARSAWFTPTHILLVLAVVGLLAFEVWREVEHRHSPPFAPIDPIAINAEIHGKAFEFFAGFVDGYKHIRDKASEPGAIYNDLMKSQVADEKSKGTALGLAIDDVMRPVVDDKDTKFKDPNRADRAYQIVIQSLKAGLRDAAK